MRREMSLGLYFNDPILRIGYFTRLLSHSTDDSIEEVVLVFENLLRDCDRQHRKIIEVVNRDIGEIEITYETYICHEWGYGKPIAARLTPAANKAE